MIARSGCPLRNIIPAKKERNGLVGERWGRLGKGWQQVKGGTGEEASKGGQLGQEAQICLAVQAQLV